MNRRGVSWNLHVFSSFLLCSHQARSTLGFTEDAAAEKGSILDGGYRNRAYLVERGGFEPPKASPTDLQSVPFGRSGTSPTQDLNSDLGNFLLVKKKNGKSMSYKCGIRISQSLNFIYLTKTILFVKQYFHAIRYISPCPCTLYRNILKTTQSRFPGTRGNNFFFLLEGGS